MEYMNPGLYRFSLAVWNERETIYMSDGKEKVEIVTIGLGTRECMDEVTLKLRPAEAKRLAEALLTAAGRTYTPDPHGFCFGTNPNEIHIVGIFDKKYNTETCRDDATCYACGYEWSMRTIEEIEACPKCGVKPEESW